MTKFQDPTNDAELKLSFDLLRAAESPENVLMIITEALPGWLCRSTDRYCEDYPSLNKNWEILCQKANTEKKMIYTVKEIVFDDKHLLQNIFCERLSREGFIMRREEELCFCKVCEAAIPSKKIHGVMKHHNLPVPEVWRDCCSKCEN